MSAIIPELTTGLTACVGKDFLVYINTGASEAVPTWTLVGGQRSATLNVDTDSIDASDKTSGGWKVNLPGLSGWSLDLGGLVELQDAGLQALEYASQNQKMVHIKFKYPDGTIQTGKATLSKFSIDAPHDGEATLSGTLDGAGALSARTPSMTPLLVNCSKAAPADKTFSITPTTATVSTVKIDGVAKTIATDYTYTSGALLVKSATLGALAIGDHTLAVTTGDGATLTAIIAQAA